VLRIGLLLTGCGALDGSDPTQVVLWRLVAAREGHVLVPMAPDVDQHDVVGPQGVVAGARRRVSDESMRLTGGVIESAARVRADEIDVLVVPGGLGAAKTLCDAAVTEPVTVLDGPAVLARALTGAGGVVVVVDEAVVWAAHVFAERAPLDLATDDRFPVERDVRDQGHRPVAAGADPVVDATARVVSHWIPASLDVARMLEHTETLLATADRLFDHD
jgi:enhancing lycopene biosynthesis protein 2